MTKLMQWLFVLTVLGGSWIAVISEKFMSPLSPQVKEIILVLPLYLLMVFACYSLALLGYRVYIFNDCEEAAAELQQEIIEARADLKKKGFNG